MSKLTQPQTMPSGPTKVRCKQGRKQRQRARIILCGTIGSSILLLGLMGFTFARIQATLNTYTAYPPINGVSCDAGQNAYHIHKPNDASTYHFPANLKQ